MVNLRDLLDSRIIHADRREINIGSIGEWATRWEYSIMIAPIIYLCPKFHAHHKLEVKVQE